MTDKGLPMRPQSQPATAFGHPSEAEFARVLDRLRVSWDYARVSFVVRRGADGSPVESFTPDFYLPSLDELTTPKASLVRRKVRKARLLRDVVPGVRIVVLDGQEIIAALKVAGRLRSAIAATRDLSAGRPDTSE